MKWTAHRGSVNVGMLSRVKQISAAAEARPKILPRSRGFALDFWESHENTQIRQTSGTHRGRVPDRQRKKLSPEGLGCGGYRQDRFEGRSGKAAGAWHAT